MELGATGCRVSNVNQKVKPFVTAAAIGSRSQRIRIGHHFLQFSNASFHVPRDCACKANVKESSNVEAVEKVKKQFDSCVNSFIFICVVGRFIEMVDYLIS